MPLRFLTAGESHGPALVAILEGLPAGLPVDLEAVNRELARRQQGLGAGPRMKIEADRAVILSGVLEGVTTGAPIAVQIENRDHTKWRGRAVEPMTVPRPGHVDLAAALKYGYRDLRPGLERASARETAARVAVGALCKQFLRAFGIVIGSYVVQIGPIRAELPEDLPYPLRLERAETDPVRCPDPEASARMQAVIEQVIREKDTLGGVIEGVALGVPPGLGSHVHWDRRLSARLMMALGSIPAVKGVEIGEGFALAGRRGTEAQDGIFREGEALVRRTHRAGGIEGGISNGAPIVVRVAFKPIATTLTPQPSVDLRTGQPTETRYERSDFCPVPRAGPIVEAMMAFVLADALLEKLGGDTMEECRSRFEVLRKAQLNDLLLDGEPHIFWP
ncbi:chorismate synthase [Thermoflexus sp.]|uniref:chorismate synthase n=1 Tax=Thermoflexus sp. TaxID=1969742 RepID=UPI0025CE5097|nr:chorismate synthase [Thermoflexus sp.]MCS7351283.1 chorismate synthase [Thermoflexus sp.]MCX7690928.1 chorismate synthase [Thermoflexus sp.]MDW8180737.1 chorismate synthase [Anaerolineae bacterium]MDW8183837.1 chorismate synthase [Anaerolineae bacterium]